MEKNFKVGDRVRLNPETTQGLGYRDFRGKDAVIINAYPHIDLYEISIGNKPISTSVKSNGLVIVEPYDPKTAFLSELKELLAKYDASIIGGGYEGYGDYLQIQLKMDEPFDVGESEYGERCILTADNIMDYNKE